jgi:hypothetical protein
VDNVIQLRLSYVGSMVNRKAGWSQIGLRVGVSRPASGTKKRGR